MSLSKDSRWMLQRAIEKIQGDGYEVWGFLLQANDDGEPEDIEAFSSYTDDGAILVSNTLQALKAIAPDIETPKPEIYEA